MLQLYLVSLISKFIFVFCRFRNIIDFAKYEKDASAVDNPKPFRNN